MTKHPKKTPPSYSTFGVTTILLVFVMICIVMISTLSFVTANADYKLSKKVAEKNSLFSSAEEEAYHVLQIVEQALVTAYTTTATQSGYWSSVEQALSDVDMDGSFSMEDGYTYSYEIPISDQQRLHVVLALYYPQTDNEVFVKIKTWQSIYDAMDFEEGTLNLID